MDFFETFLNWPVMLRVWPMLVKGIWNTVALALTTIVLGGGTMPLMKYLERRTSGRAGRRRRKKDITMSKTSEFGAAIDSEHLSELTSGGEELETSFAEGRAHLKGFMLWDFKYLRPFFIRK